MKRYIVLSALAAAVAFGGFAAHSVAIAGTKESCKHHLQGFSKTSGPAQEAMKKNYAACLKAK